ncbi:hypothetical protein SAMD00079811_29850 [Scytonema sp. HK-05]|nr:hypothetical protein SAMD00079811_29850 [Scytonema sp. HK-05]
MEKLFEIYNFEFSTPPKPKGYPRHTKRLARKRKRPLCVSVRTYAFRVLQAYLGVDHLFR